MKRYTAEFHRDGDDPLLSQRIRTLAARDSEQLEDELSDWLQSNRDGDDPLLSQRVRTLAARDSEQPEDELSDWLQSIHRLCSRCVSLVRAGDRVLGFDGRE